MNEETEAWAFVQGQTWLEMDRTESNSQSLGGLMAELGWCRTEVH